MEKHLSKKTFFFKKTLGIGLPTLNKRRREEFIFILAVICVPIGENFEVFLYYWYRESLPPFERALRLFMVRCVAGDCPQLRDSFMMLFVSG